MDDAITAAAGAVVEDWKRGGTLETTTIAQLDAVKGKSKLLYMLFELVGTWDLTLWMLCQITGGHAAVDIFTDKLPPRINRILRAVIEVVFAAVLVLIAVQLASGMMSKLRSGQTTFLLQFPLWWAYALSLTGAVAAAVVGVYMALVRITEALRNQTILADEGGAEP